MGFLLLSIILFSFIACTYGLVFLPILPAWSISIYEKYNWQITENSPFCLLTKENTHSPILGGMQALFHTISCYLEALIILWGPKESLGLLSPDGNILCVSIISGSSLESVLEVELRHLGQLFQPGISQVDFLDQVWFFLDQNECTASHFLWQQKQNPFSKVTYLMISVLKPKYSPNTYLALLQ